MKKRKSQVSIVLIIVIIILVVVVLYTFRNDSLKDQTPVLSEEAIRKNQVEEFILSCAKETVKAGIYSNGRQGGYHYVPNDPVPAYFKEGIVPFYFFNGSLHLPQTADFERSIEDFFTNSLHLCIKDFADIDLPGTTIESSKHTITATISDKGVDATLQYPVSIIMSDQNTIQTAEEYTFFVAFNYKRIIETIETILNELRVSEDLIPLTFLNQLSEEESMTYGIVNTEIPSRHKIFYFTINETIEEGPFYFHAFAYDQITIVETEPEEAQNQIIPLQQAIVGYPFELDLKEYVEGSTYSSSTDLFTINNGKISFTPSDEQIGDHLIQITIQNGEQAKTASLSMTILADNEPPEIESIPFQEALVNSLFSYTVRATDPENDAILFSVAGPENLIIHPSDGKILFKPKEDQLGYHDVVITASDSNGNTAETFFTLEVKDE